MISYFPSCESQLQAHTLKWKFTEEQSAIMKYGWKWKSLLLSATWKGRWCQGKLTFTKWRMTAQVGSFHNTTQSQKCSVCKLPYHKRYLTSVPINHQVNHCHKAITLIKQYQAEKLSAELPSCLLGIYILKRLLRPCNSSQINGWHRNTSTHFRTNAMSKPESLRVHLRFSLTSEAGTIQYTYNFLS